MKKLKKGFASLTGNDNDNPNGFVADHDNIGVRESEHEAKSLMLYNDIGLPEIGTSQAVFIVGVNVIARYLVQILTCDNHMTDSDEKPCMKIAIFFALEQTRAAVYNCTRTILMKYALKKTIIIKKANSNEILLGNGSFIHLYCAKHGIDASFEKSMRDGVTFVMIEFGALHLESVGKNIFSNYVLEVSDEERCIACVLFELKLSQLEAINALKTHPAISSETIIASKILTCIKFMFVTIVLLYLFIVLFAPKK